MDLSGTWEFWADPARIGEAIGVFQPDGGTGVEDYGGWQEITVPGHWQADPRFADLAGPGWYRTRFAAPTDAGGFPFLAFAGVDFSADVWLNGDYLGFHEGDFAPFGFPVTLQAENLLVVRVAAPAQEPAGICGPVSLVCRPTLHVASLLVTPYLAGDYRQADLVVQIAVENYGDRPVTEPLRILVAPGNFAGGGVRHPLIVTFPPGRSEHTFTVTLKRPELWDLDSPSLYKAMVLVGGEAVPQAETLFGIREFRLGEDGELWLNGERRPASGAVRVALRVEEPEFYRRCDEEGVLICQALPFQWGSGFFAQRACALAQAAVRQVYNHPSVVAFCGDFGQPDAALRRAIAAVDRTRPVVDSSVLADLGLR